MKILVGFDHRGIDAAEHLAARLQDGGRSVELCGPERGTPCDYPGIALDAARRVVAGAFDFAILIDASGLGMSIAANKVHGIRAVTVHDELTARIARSHLNANVLCMSADLTSHATMERMVEEFEQTQFEAGRHERRLEKIGLIEAGRSPGADAEPAN